MTVETATKISQLNALWPAGTDPKSEGDDHLRLIKGTLQSVFDDSGTSLKTTLSIQPPAYIDPIFVPSADVTKKLSLDLSQVTTATTRKLWVPDADVALDKWEHIKTVAVGAVSSIDFINLGAFQFIEVLGFVQGSAASNPLQARTSSTNGSSFDSGASDYALQIHSATNAAVSAASAAFSAMQISAGSGVGTVALRFLLANFNKSGIANSIYQTGGTDGSGQMCSSTGSGQMSVGNARNALRLFVTAGTLNGSQLTIRGRRG